MSKLFWILIIILIIVALYCLYNVFCSKSSCIEEKAIYPDEAKILIKENFFDYIIDVRTKDEWNLGHYPTAINIGMERLVFDLPKVVPNIMSRILFYCAKGRRAAGAASIAKTLGYNNIRYLIGTYTDL